jgi:hypothetical protein
MGSSEGFAIFAADMMMRINFESSHPEDGEDI